MPNLGEGYGAAYIEYGFVRQDKRFLAAFRQKTIDASLVRVFIQRSGEHYFIIYFK